MAQFNRWITYNPGSPEKFSHTTFATELEFRASVTLTVGQELVTMGGRLLEEDEMMMGGRQYK